MPNPRSRIFSRAISSVRSTPCFVPVWERWLTATLESLRQYRSVGKPGQCEAGELRLVRAPGSKYYGNVFKRNYMIQREGQFKGYPLRTYVGNNFQGGYSDHFPVYIYFAK